MKVEQLVVQIISLEIKLVFDVISLVMNESAFSWFGSYVINQISASSFFSFVVLFYLYILIGSMFLMSVRLFTCLWTPSIQSLTEYSPISAVIQNI